MNITKEIPIITPEIGAEEQAVRLSCWLVDVGDPVNSGDRIVELVLNGITFDISAEVSGILSQIDVYADSEVQPGLKLGEIEISSSDPEGF